jgi:hypothetical protein
MSKPRTIAALVGANGFASLGTSNLANDGWRSGSLIIRTQRSNRRVGARDLVSGMANINFVSQAFSVLDHGTVPCIANASTLTRFQTFSEVASRPRKTFVTTTSVKEPPFAVNAGKTSGYWSPYWGV